MQVFGAGPFSFALDDGRALDLPEFVEVYREALDVALLGSARLPPLGAAPVASWLLARLAQLTGGDLGFDPEQVEVCADPVAIVDLVALEGTQVVGRLQLQAGAPGAGLLGVCLPGAEEALHDALLGALLADPAAVGELAVTVETPDGARHRLGRLGGEYLAGVPIPVAIG